MKWAQLGLDYIRALTGPIFWLVLVILFRKQLATLIGRIKKFSGFGATAEFESRARQADNAASKLAKGAASGQKGAFTTTDTTSRNHRDDRISSTDAIVRAWDEVEDVVVRLSGSITLSAATSEHPARSGAIQRIVNELEKQGRIPDGASQVVQDLQSMRNQLVHDPDMVLTAKAADSLLNAIKQLKNALE